MVFISRAVIGLDVVTLFIIAFFIFCLVSLEPFGGRPRIPICLLFFTAKSIRFHSDCVQTFFARINLRGKPYFWRRRQARCGADDNARYSFEAIPLRYLRCIEMGKSLFIEEKNSINP